jgi:4-hydroxybenzoate polyprenyltransferase
LAYIFINIFYSFWLKHVPVLDIAIIGMGFVLRILLGGVAMDIEISSWLIIVTFVLALFLALGKRHDDLLLLEETGSSLRKSLDGYNLKFTSQGMTLLAGSLFILYFNYLTAAPAVTQLNQQTLYLSAIFVLLGMLRYLQLTFVYQKSGSPVKQLFSDLFLQIITILWLGHFTYLRYF